MRNADVTELRQAASIGMGAWSSWTYEPDRMWGAWHATRYRYVRMRDPSVGLDYVVLEPVPETVFCAETPVGFIAAINCSVGDLFNDHIMSGTRCLVLRGQPKKTRLFRIPLYADRVIYGGETHEDDDRRAAP